jgi:tetratricopeptide (TPR) repeat protein
MQKNARILLLCLFLAILTTTAFWEVGNCDFVGLDDHDYVTENGHVQSGITIPGIRWALTAVYASNWHPLTWMSHMLDVQIFGLKARWHHLDNLLFHVANTLLLFLLLSRMTKAPWKSFFAAALFAIHPLHVESVAWVAERKDVLSTFFWMLTLWAYARYVERPRLSAYLAALIFFALGLTAKPMLVTLPFVLLLLDFWPLRRFEVQNPVKEAAPEGNKPVPAKKGRKKPAGAPVVRETVTTRQPAAPQNQWTAIRLPLLEKIPFFLLTAISCVVTYIAQEYGGSVASLEKFSPGVRIANAIVSYVLYIAKTVWPENLAVYYPHPGSRPIWQVAAAFLLLSAITLAVIRTRRKFPYLQTGWLWFAGTLVPVSGVVQVGGQAMADRYTYVPLIGLFIMAAWGIPEILGKRVRRKEVLWSLSALTLACLFILTRTQVGYWKGNITLFDHALEVTENNFLIHNNRGAAYADLGNYRQAIEDYTKAVEINPRSALAYNNRGTAYGHLGNDLEAINDFSDAIEIKPEYAEAYNNRGAAHGRLGSAALAIGDFDRAVAINPEYAEAFNNRGAAYDRLGDHTRAIGDFDRAVAINPEYTKAYYNRGIAYYSLGDQARAIRNFDRAIELNPRFAEAYNNRGIAQEALGNHAAAIADFGRAIAINPEYTRAYYNRAGALSIAGDQSRAVEDLKSAARLGDADARSYLKSQGINW